MKNEGVGLVPDNCFQKFYLSEFLEKISNLDLIGKIVTSNVSLLYFFSIEYPFSQRPMFSGCRLLVGPFVPLAANGRTEIAAQPNHMNRSQ